jgi:hypothetical protein
MKKLTKFWGVFLAIVLASTLILSAAPVSAGTLSWGSEDLPDELEPGTDIVGLAVSGDGSTIYAANATSVIYRSTNGGEGWTSITVIDGSTTIDADFIAVAPDDPNYIAVAQDDATVYISDDAGANWDSLGQVNLGATIDDVNDLAISVEKGGNHFVAVAGNDGGLAAEIWYYEIGAIGSTWQDAHNDTGFAGVEDAVAVEFSPNFYSDQVMAAVTLESGVDVYYEVYSFNTNTWNAGAFPSETGLAQDSETPTTLDAASIAMAPDYLGSDDSMRIVFVGLTVDVGTDDDATDGIFRLDDDDVEVLKDEEAIYSVAFDGSLLVAGHYEEITIYRSTDPLDDSPSVSGSTGTREPGGKDKVVVGIAGDKVVAGTSGPESAFAYSEDNGKTFNDLSLIDTALTTLSDVAITPDGGIVYLVTADGTPDLSVWALEDRWERIYNLQGADADSDYIIRMAPNDSDVIYLGNKGDTEIYFSSAGGMDKWHTRVYKEASIDDMAVETDGDTVYVLTSLGYVSKSTNRGFTWDSKKSSKLTGGSNMIASLGEDLVIAGSSDGNVSYSTDGNTTWTKLDHDMGGAVQVTATGLSDGDIVLGGDDTSGKVYRWELGDDDEWDSIGDLTAGYAVTGVGITEGVLYFLTDNTTDSIMLRTLTPTSDDPTWSTVASAGETFDAVPTALRSSVSGSTNQMWAIDTLGQQLFSYKDTLAAASVASRAPADGVDVPFNTVSGDASQIIFSWVSPSDKVTEFDFDIATDTGFDEDVLSLAIVKSSGTWDEGDIISQIVGPGASGDGAISFMPDQTYYWRVRVDAGGPVRSAWSETRSFTLGSLPEVLPPVVIEQPPAPVIEVPPAPAITLQPPEIVLPPQPAPPPDIVIPAAPEPTPPVPTWAIYAIIIIGAVLVLALIILIMRTRRPM